MPHRRGCHTGGGIVELRKSCWQGPGQIIAGSDQCWYRSTLDLIKLDQIKIKLKIITSELRSRLFKLRLKFYQEYIEINLPELHQQPESTKDFIELFNCSNREVPPHQQLFLKNPAGLCFIIVLLAIGVSEGIWFDLLNCQFFV